MSERVSDAVLDLFCDEAWLDDRPQSHSVLLMARELRDRRRATPDPASGMEMDSEFVRLVEDVTGMVYPPFRGWQEWERMRAERIAALHRWHLDAVERAVREAFREGYHDAVDPAWTEKQLRRAGVKAEAHEAAAEEYFWNTSDVKASVTDA